MAPSPLRRLLWLPLVQLCAGAAVGSPQPGRLPEAERFLEKYGYLGSTQQGMRPAVFSEAVREFQQVSHLTLSGRLDSPTVHQMSLPRCGVNDAGSLAAWKERVDALFLGRRAEKKRRKRGDDVFVPVSGSQPRTGLPPSNCYCKQEHANKKITARTCNHFRAASKILAKTASGKHGQNARGERRLLTGGKDMHNQKEAPKQPAGVFVCVTVGTRPCIKGRGFREAWHSYPGGQWYKRHLTYRVVNWPWYLPQQQVRLAVKAAFELWSNVSSLVFWEATSDSADIRLTFFHGDHNDGTDNAFDGPGGALAHAFFPRRGEAHFDNDERWSLDSSKGRNLFVVVAHEIGHTLGLEHSPVRRALMSPYYKKLGKDFVLSWDDILAIQNLYGKPPWGSTVQLPGKLFARFQDWSQDIEGGEHQEGNRSAHYCRSFFDAITVDLEGNLYIFKGGYFWTISRAGNTTGPQLLRTKWPGLPSTVDAAAFSEEDGKFYFFKGGRCWRYVGPSLEAGFPRKCSSTGDLPRHPDATLYFQPLHHLVLFKGPKYYVVNEETFQVEPYYPRSLRDWGGVPVMANGALTHSDGFVYFFRDDRFWKFDPDKLQVVASGKWAPQLRWLGCQAEDPSQAGA